MGAEIEVNLTMRETLKMLTMNMSSEMRWSLFAIALLSIMSLGFFFPCFSGYSLDGYYSNPSNDDNNTPINHPYVIDLTLTAATILLPIQIDLLITAYLKGWNSDRLETFSLAFSLFIAYIGQYFASYDLNYQTIFSSFTWMENWFTIGICVITLNRIGHGKYVQAYSIIMALQFMSSIATMVYQVQLNDHVEYFSFACRFSAAAILVFVLIVELRICVNDSASSESIKENSTRVLVATTLLCRTCILNVLYGAATSLGRRNYEYLVGLLIASIFFNVLLTLIRGRIQEHATETKPAEIDSKRVFVRYVSHELLTPLNILSMGLGLVEDHLRDGDVREAKKSVAELRSSCASAVGILEDLLLFEKLEADEVQLQRQVVRSHVDLIEAAMSRHRDDARSKQLTLTFVNEVNFDPPLYLDMDKVDE